VSEVEAVKKKAVEPRGDFRVSLSKALVYRLKLRALDLSARTGARVTWVALLEQAAEALLQGGSQ
jgi:hypothetical protein